MFVQRKWLPYREDKGHCFANSPEVTGLTALFYQRTKQESNTMLSDRRLVSNWRAVIGGCNFNTLSSAHQRICSNRVTLRLKFCGNSHKVTWDIQASLSHCLCTHTNLIDSYFSTYLPSEFKWLHLNAITWWRSTHITHSKPVQANSAPLFHRK